MSSLIKLCGLALVLSIVLGSTQCVSYRYKEPVPAVNDPAVTKRDTTKTSRLAPSPQNKFPAATE